LKPQTGGDRRHIGFKLRPCEAYTGAYQSLSCWASSNGSSVNPMKAPRTINKAFNGAITEMFFVLQWRNGA